MAKKEHQVSASDFNLQRLSTRDLEQQVEATIKMGGNIALFGRRGIGKTVISKQKISDMKMKEVYLNLSVMERVDIGGYPNIMNSDPKRKFVDFLLPEFYQSLIEGSEPVVALLDEVDKADPSLFAPLLEFTQFRTINGKKLPNLAAIITTGNLLSEGGSRPSPPLLDRMEKFLIEADLESWLNWAGKKGKIHSSITSYISDNPNDLFGAVDPEDRYADPSPRGWARASEILYKGEELGLSPDLLIKKVTGCVGKDAGIKYVNYFEHYQQLLPLVEQIFLGQDITDRYESLERTKKLVATMIVCARLASILDQGDKNKIATSVKNVGRFLQSAADEDFLVAVRSQIQLDRLVSHGIDEHPDWESKLSKIRARING